MCNKQWVINGIFSEKAKRELRSEIFSELESEKIFRAEYLNRSDSAYRPTGTYFITKKP